MLKIKIHNLDNLQRSLREKNKSLINKFQIESEDLYPDIYKTEDEIKNQFLNKKRYYDYSSKNLNEIKPEENMKANLNSKIDSSSINFKNAEISDDNVIVTDLDKKNGKEKKKFTFESKKLTSIYTNKI